MPPLPLPPALVLQALFRVPDTDACDHFISRLISLHQGARDFFARMVHGLHARQRHDTGTTCAGTTPPAPSAAQSLDLGGPHGLTLSAQPLLTVSGSAADPAVPALLVELAFRDAALPLLSSMVRAEGWLS